MLFFYLYNYDNPVYMSTIQYLSQEGYDKLDAELKDLKTRGRREIAAEIAEARAKGDLSENAEYDAAKEAQGHMEDRITKLEDILANARILDAKDLDLSQVRVLTKVTILNKKVGKEMTYTLVSANEADFKANKISIDSPIGKGLLGKKVGDVAEVKVPAGMLELEILKIEI
ncbi:MAG: transcription elongation factor GreA [Balneolales bacterium]|nr:transcription elongation factor GreA [Balneolales bacterium]